MSELGEGRRVPGAAVPCLARKMRKRDPNMVDLTHPNACCSVSLGGRHPEKRKLPESEYWPSRSQGALLHQSQNLSDAGGCQSKSANFNLGEYQAGR